MSEVKTFTTVEANPREATEKADKATDAWMNGRFPLSISTTMTLLDSVETGGPPWFVFTLTIALAP